jgi:hypothetical protein
MYFMIWVLVLGSGLRQGDITYLEATSQSSFQSWVPSVPKVAARVYPYTIRPLFLALITSSAASLLIRWTI